MKKEELGNMQIWLAILTVLTLTLITICVVALENHNNRIANLQDRITVLQQNQAENQLFHDEVSDQLNSITAVPVPKDTALVGCQIEYYEPRNNTIIYRC